MQRYGVIDLGTNTFHLLVVEQQENGELITLFRHRIFVKLAEESIKYIADAPFKRGLDAMHYFKTILDKYKITQVKAFGTAALRTASNAKIFIKKIAEETAIKVAVIEGREEAHLIYMGVKEVVSFGEETGLIMDIGGGSVEFIVANKTKIIWSESFPIGVAVLTQRFHREDPISTSSVAALQQYLTETLAPLKAVLTTHQIDTLIGASGTFDVLENILVQPSQAVLSSSFPTAQFAPLYERLISSSLEERLAMETIPDSRAEMIVTALILIKYILDLSGADKITVSAYAMKEGILMEWLGKDLDLYT